jgi:hypothetical protein
MAKLNSSLLREMLNEVIISHRNGKPYLKRKPKKVNNPKTEQQCMQRGKFRAANAFVSRNLDELIRPYWNPEAKRRGMTGQNLFCKINTQAFDADGNPDFEKLQATVGDLAGAENLHMEMLDEKTLRLTWKDTAGKPKSNKQNQLKVFGMDESLKVQEFSCNVIREKESLVLMFNLKQYKHLFLFFWSPEFALASSAKMIEIKEFIGSII